MASVFCFSLTRFETQQRSRCFLVGLFALFGLVWLCIWWRFYTWFGFGFSYVWFDLCLYVDSNVLRFVCLFFFLFSALFHSVCLALFSLYTSILKPFFFSSLCCVYFVFHSCFFYASLRIFVFFLFLFYFSLLRGVKFDRVKTYSPFCISMYVR